MSTITVQDLRIISNEPRSLTIKAKDWDRPIKCEVTPYENGIVIQIPWVHRERLGSPDYNALKHLVCRLYSGTIGTRTETDPRFRRAAEAREAKVATPTDRITPMLKARKSA